MRRFIATYRWELWLIVGIPVIAELVRTFAFVHVDALPGLNDTFGSLPFFVASVVGLSLLGVSYPRVKRLGRDFLPVLWAYVVVTSAIGTIAAGAGSFVEVGFSEVPLGTVALRWFTVYSLAALPHLLALFWFARRASALSLAHAFFLVVYAQFTVADPVGMSSSAEGASRIEFVLAASVITPIVLLIKVWLLGNVDLRGPRFRRNAVIGLIATVILSGFARLLIAELIGYGPGLASESVEFAGTTAIDVVMLLVVFCVVYLVRERHPTASQQA